MLGAFSAPIAITAAGLAFSYAGCLLLPHYVANVAFAAASFGVQAFAAAVVARVLYRAGPRRALFAFTRALRPQEVMFVALALIGGKAGALVAAGCLLWQVVANARFFAGLQPGWPRAVGATCLHYAIIAVLVGGYARAFDLFPYPPGVP